MAAEQPLQKSIDNIRRLVRPIPLSYLPRLDEIVKTSAFSVPPRKSCQLIYVLGGRGQLNRGQDVSLDLRSGLICYLHGNREPLVCENRENLLLYRMEISFEINEREGEPYPDDEWHFSGIMTNPGRITSLLEQIDQLIPLQNHPLERNLGSSLIHGLLGEIYEEIKHPWEQADMTVRKIREVCRMMEEHPAERYSLDELAGRVNLSPSYLGHRFKELVGLSPYRYQLQVRMAHARKLLREDRFTVARTAELCGYANPYVFTRVFKEVTGTTPGKV